MTMTMEAEFSPEMLITSYQSTPCHDTEDGTNIDSFIYKFLSVLMSTWQDDATVQQAAVQVLLCTWQDDATVHGRMMLLYMAG
jgi:hypothetical protein